MFTEQLPSTSTELCIQIYGVWEGAVKAMEADIDQNGTLKRENQQREGKKKKLKL